MMTTERTYAWRENPKLIASTISGVIIAITLAILAWNFAATGQDRALNFAFVATGAAVGWLLGMLASPYGAVEKKQFSALTKAISLFLSGYLLAKTDHLVDALMAPDLILQPIAGFRALACLGAIVTATIVTFVFRQYA